MTASSTGVSLAVAVAAGGGGAGSLRNEVVPVHTAGGTAAAISPSPFRRANQKLLNALAVAEAIAVDQEPLPGNSDDAVREARSGAMYGPLASS